jgi:hypothetical protein
MACSTNCATPGAHETYGECLRAKAIQIDRHGLLNSMAEKDKDRRLGEYESLRRHGVQPKTTQWADVRDAAERGGVPRTEVRA